MSSQLSIKVGATTVNLPVGASDAQVADVLTRYLQARGLPTTGTVTERLTLILETIRDDIKHYAKQKQAADLRASNETSIGVTTEQDNSL